MNELYANELTLMMNLFQPSVKLVEKIRLGGKVTRRYDKAQTPLDRLVAYHRCDALALPIQRLLAIRENINPFDLSQQIEQKLKHIEKLRRNNTEEKCAVL